MLFAFGEKPLWSRIPLQRGCMSDILDRAETILTNARSEWAVRYMQASLALDLLPELIAEIKQQAAYVARLEAAYVELCKDCYFRPFDWNDHTDEAKTKAEKHARDALERIKNEK